MNKEYMNKKGQRHRLDGPAVELTNGYKAWYKEEKLHRLDGHAVEYANGDKYWYKEGQFVKHECRNKEGERNEELPLRAPPIKPESEVPLITLLTGAAVFNAALSLVKNKKVVRVLAGKQDSYTKGGRYGRKKKNYDIKEMSHCRR